MSLTTSRSPFSLGALRSVIDGHTSRVRSKIVAMYVLLGAATVVAWMLAVVAFAGRPLLLGTAALAYTFGLRHAVDADHISAIDNVTRKLMQQGRRPVAVGFFFSLGHSTIVVALTVGIAVASVTMRHALPGLENAGGLIGTLVSAGFLFAIAILNVLIFLDVYAAFRAVRRGDAYSETSIDESLANRGLMGRFFRPLMKFVSKSGHMYPIGVLFGLGFDTATEVGLLGIAAIEGGKGLPIWDILIFPLLFTVGMSLLDTTDGILMLGAYGWAYVKPLRKLYYNMNVTLVSIVVALLVGTIEVLGIVSGQLALAGPFWDAVARIDDNFGMLGFGVLGIFMLAWALSFTVYKLRRYDDTEPVTMGPGRGMPPPLPDP